MNKFPTIHSHPVCFEDLKCIINCEYERVWRQWFPAEKEKASLNIFIASETATAKYWYRDLIELPLLAADVDEYFKKHSLIEHDLCQLEDVDWGLWRASLILEMLHEYDYKCMTTATNSGVELEKHLRQCNSLYFPPEKHPTTFYSALADKASDFNMPAVDFANLLR